MTLGSQVDIPATIIDLAGIRSNYSGIGKSLLRDYKDRFVVFRRGNYMGIITPQGILSHDLKNKLEYKSYSPDPNNDYSFLLERKLLTIDQTLFYLLKRNRFYKE
jgi:phosphoglycerol transferase MdoB-like AlkP superfamily enzyme